MRRYKIDICTCDNHAPINHLKYIPTDDGPWVLYEDHADRIAKLEQQLAAMTAERDSESRWAKKYSDEADELRQQLAAAQERERTLNDELYYACELAIAYAHSEKDKEWAAERIEELMPPEQESDHDH